MAYILTCTTQPRTRSYARPWYTDFIRRVPQGTHGHVT
ncbi:hypothetical protein F383_22139 [Gossypium arboreum]|uniref:Uncharacterized protein n=1 Tax=Gossypium arboreum TaxID=29729 RepID=A0A0B0MM55_GOSAR|nr:hypothetical protein F383_22139 [Gossypium arboreum]